VIWKNFDEDPRVRALRAGPPRRRKVSEIVVAAAVFSGDS